MSAPSFLDSAEGSSPSGVGPQALQPSLAGFEELRGWDVVERVERSRMGNYTLERVEDRQEYEMCVSLLARLSVEQVRRILGWGWRTVARVRDAESHRIAEAKMRLGRQAMRIAQSTLEAFEEDLHAGLVQPKDKAIAFGIISEKALLWMGEATQIHAQKGAEGADLAKLNALLEALPSAKAVDVASVVSERKPLAFQGGLVVGCGSGCSSGGADGQEAAGPEVSQDQKGAGGGIGSPPAHHQPDGF